MDQTQNCHQFAKRIRDGTWGRWREKYRGKFRKEWSQSNFIVVASVSLVNLQTRQFEIVSVGVGTKSMPESVMLEHGREQLHEDMHAEMLAIQGFKKFLLKELSKGSGEYLEWFSKKKKFQVREKYGVYLYCSQIFCGDCCVNQKEESFSGAKPLKYFREEKYPELKYEPNILRTKPGRLDLPMNKRSHVLSCSDRLAFCNLVGIQGSELFSLVTPVYLKGVIVDCSTELRQSVVEGIDFIKRLSQLLGRSESLVERQMFNLIMEGKERKVSGQLRRNKPDVIVFDKKAENKVRDHQGFELCGIFTGSDEEWINGKSGLPEGSSLKSYRTKGKASKFSESRLQFDYPDYKQGQDSFKYHAVEERLRWLFGEWVDGR